MDVGLVVVTVGSAAGIVAVVVAVLAWLRPKKRSNGRESRERVQVEVAYAIPVYDMPDGRQEFGDDMMSIAVRNRTSQAVKVNGWGVRLPGNRNMIARKPMTAWEPQLPCWVPPGDDATWYLPVDEVRAQAAALHCSFNDMIAYVSLADGREINALKGMPLK